MYAPLKGCSQSVVESGLSIHVAIYQWPFLGMFVCIVKHCILQKMTIGYTPIDIDLIYIDDINVTVVCT